MATHVMEIMTGGGTAFVACFRSVMIWVDRSSGSFVIWLGRGRCKPPED
jgi:hypothetical protein